jgi:hypothetical protein
MAMRLLLATMGLGAAFTTASSLAMAAARARTETTFDVLSAALLGATGFDTAKTGSVSGALNTSNSSFANSLALSVCPKPTAPAWSANMTPAILSQLRTRVTRSGWGWGWATLRCVAVAVPGDPFTVAAAVASLAAICCTFTGRKANIPAFFNGV